MKEKDCADCDVQMCDDSECDWCNYDWYYKFNDKGKIELKLCPPCARNRGLEK